ncbi:hypothetical protein [Amycolatopsis sp. FDAARGOS 1241]|uniref:hypothetical protein n=1 Tax=Amycolatopsis sp. FDAARGOS 1241 TaxID=2778070 RepID=UPI00195143CF|nr:hypothetical protein [Amycolatopsis sp. FDAARGOS 1241]QRP43115.1 hypothetical protein I6J71_27220 [Amycolatopsis sp. FDAARGOS 1241]
MTALQTVSPAITAASDGTCTTPDGAMSTCGNLDQPELHAITDSTALSTADGTTVLSTAARWHLSLAGTPHI